MTKVQDTNATEVNLVNATVYIWLLNGLYLLQSTSDRVKLFLKYKVSWELLRAYFIVRNFILDLAIINRKVHN